MRQGLMGRIRNRGVRPTAGAPEQWQHPYGTMCEVIAVYQVTHMPRVQIFNRPSDERYEDNRFDVHIHGRGVKRITGLVAVQLWDHYKTEIRRFPLMEFKPIKQHPPIFVHLKMGVDQPDPQEQVWDEGMCLAIGLPIPYELAEEI